jgi:5-methylcytosine-specific restriction endonuclease McrA
MIKCLKCNENKEEKSFLKKKGAVPSSVCFTCWKKFSAEEIIKNVSIEDESGCLLWPDQNRDSDYYNSIRRNLSEKEGKYIHVRCNKACMNSNHFFYFETNSTPYWFRYGLDGDINFSSPSEKELLCLKQILTDRAALDGDCWIFSNSSNKKTTLKIGDSSFSSKKIYYEVFSSKIKSEYFSISASCGNINCVSPNHMVLFNGRSFPFWARKNLKRPEQGMGYCQSVECEKYSIQIPENLLNKHREKLLCKTCFNLTDSNLKKKKSEYDIRYSEENREKIKNRYEVWSKTESARLSQILSSQNRRDKSLRKVNRVFLSELIKKYNSCCYCGRLEKDIQDHPCGASKLHLEHIVPILSKKENGTNDPENLDLACWQCNSMKKNLLPKDWLATLTKRIESVKESNRLDLYKRIITTLSEDSNYRDNKFVPRHMRNKNA